MYLVNGLSIVVQITMVPWLALKHSASEAHGPGIDSSLHRFLFLFFYCLFLEEHFDTHENDDFNNVKELKRIKKC